MSDEELQTRLELLKIEHRDLDEAINALVEAGNPDQLRTARLKKRKLQSSNKFWSDLVVEKSCKIDN